MDSGPWRPATCMALARWRPVGHYLDGKMLSRETLEAYRRMTASQRLALTLHMTRENTSYLLHGPPDLVSRRFARLRQENDARNRNMLTAIAYSKRAP